MLLCKYVEITVEDRVSQKCVHFCEIKGFNIIFYFIFYFIYFFVSVRLTTLLNRVQSKLPHLLTEHTMEILIQISKHTCIHLTTAPISQTAKLTNLILTCLYSYTIKHTQKHTHNFLDQNTD